MGGGARLGGRLWGLAWPVPDPLLRPGLLDKARPALRFDARHAAPVGHRGAAALAQTLAGAKGEEGGTQRPLPGQGTGNATKMQW